jgi:adenylate kinase family enzyme
MQRVLVLGCSGSGKSTFAAKLGGITGLPTVSIDALYWQPGWRTPERGQFRARLEAAAREPQWIMDGNYFSSGSPKLRLERADTIFWFDLPRRVCVTRLINRLVTCYGRVRPEMAHGCPERLNFEFLRYVWTYRRAQRPSVEQFVAARSTGQQFFHFTGRKDSDRFLAQFALNRG